ncbi:MAG TPA: hypothetical protein VFC38_06600 [Stellaceae bacterium]|jgi:hypothetical protein|nr:hypothetical protein [Stellaceae bacterium]
MSTSERTKNGAATDVETIRGDLDSLKSDLAGLMDHVKNGALQGVAGRVDDVTTEARRLYGQFTAESERQAEALARRVEERPLTSLLIAFGLGFLGGRIFFR